MQLNNRMHPQWNPSSYTASPNTPIVLMGRGLSRNTSEGTTTPHYWATGAVVLLTVVTLCLTFGLFMSDKV